MADEKNGDALPRTVRSAMIVIKEVGFPMAVAIYFFIKDWMFTESVVTLMARIVTTLDTIGRTLQP